MCQVHPEPFWRYPQSICGEGPPGLGGLQNAESRYHIGPIQPYSYILHSAISSLHGSGALQLSLTSKRSTTLPR